MRQAGDRAGAARVLAQAAARAPHNADIQHDLGMALLETRAFEQALLQFDRALSLDPTHGLSHFRRGVALELLGRDGATQAYERAVTTAPTLAEAHACLANAREQQGRRQEALGLYRQARDTAAPGSPQRMMYEARAALIAEDLDTGEQAIRALLKLQPKLANARGLLASILSARGDFTQAAIELETALRDNPRDVSLYYNLTQIRRLKPGDEDLIARMRGAQSLAMPNTARIRLHLAVARGLHDLANTQDATAELEAADALRARHQPMDRAALRAFTDGMIALFTRAYLSRPDHRVSESDKPILVLGLPRSGTTLVEQILGRHSSIDVAGELGFWSADGEALLAHLAPDTGADLREACAAYLAQLGSAHYVVDKNPFNYRTALLAHLAFPRARIIHCRRCPADTALSIMMTALRPQALFGSAREDLLFCFAEYHRLMAHARGVVPPEVFYELDYEKLVADPRPEIGRLLDFLHLPFESACLSPERGTRAVRTASVWQVRQEINTGSVGRWRHYARLVGAFEDVLS